MRISISCSKNSEKGEKLGVEGGAIHVSRVGEINASGRITENVLFYPNEHNTSFQTVLSFPFLIFPFEQQVCLVSLRKTALKGYCIAI